MNSLSNAELRILYLRRNFLKEFIPVIGLQTRTNLDDSWEGLLARIKAVREEIKVAVDDPQFDVLVSAPRVSGGSGSGYSAVGTIANVLATARELSAYIDGVLQIYLSPKADELKQDPTAAAKIFIGHGRNEVVRHKVKDFVRERCGFQPLVLQDLPSSGMTLIEKLEKYGRTADYAVLILTGDDVAEGEEELRARQNVLQELGWFQGVLGRRRTAILRQSGVEIASNINGVVYLGFEGDRVESTFEPLRREFEDVGLF